VSLILQSTSEPQAEAPSRAPSRAASRRRALRTVPPLDRAGDQPVDASPAASVPLAMSESPIATAPPIVTVPPGWYADPMGRARSRWWDGSAWTGELSEDAPAEAPVAVGAPEPAEVHLAAEGADPAADPAALQEFAGIAPVAVVPFGVAPVETASLDVASGHVASGDVAPAEVVSTPPLSRRQLRELIGPLTTAPVVTGPLVSGPLVSGPLASGPVASGPLASGPVTADPAVADPAVGATDFLGLAENIDSFVARPWIGAAPPMVAAASRAPGAAARPISPVAPTSPVVPTSLVVPVSPAVFVPAAVVPAAPPPATGSLGFTLPPDPVATPGLAAALQATPRAFVPSAVPVAPVPMFTANVRSSTWTVWVLALLPALQAATAWLIFGRLHLAADLPLRLALIAGPVLLALALAGADHRSLRRRGFDRVSPVVLAVIPPLYLLVRAVRVGVAGVVPLLTWLLLQAAAVSFLLIQLPTAFALAPASAAIAAPPVVAASGPITAAERANELTPTGMAAALTAQTLGKNLHFESISCPALPATSDGTTVTCVGTIASVRMNLNVVVDSSLPNSAFALLSEAPAA
jgi:hypothetical protein